MNKRHYEHTLPNIRGSLSNTYYSSALQVLWKQLKKVEATFASTAEIRRKVS